MSIMEMILSGTSILGPIVAYFTGRRKSNAETESVVLGNAQRIMEKWQEFSEKMEGRVKELEVEVKALRDELSHEKKMREELETEIHQYRLKYKA